MIYNHFYYNLFKKNYIVNKFGKKQKNTWVFQVVTSVNKTTILKALNFIFPNKKFKINTVTIKDKKKKEKKVYIIFRDHYLIK